MFGFVRTLALALALLMLLPRPGVAQDASVGEVRTARDAKIIRAGAELAAKAGTTLAEKDILLTGPKGTVGFILNDDSVITLGPKTLFRLSKFEFKPQEKKLGLFGEIFSGTLEYISGKISKLAQDAAKFRTPYTTVAARGTRLLLRAGE
jgi:hypothetical protein